MSSSINVNTNSRVTIQFFLLSFLNTADKFESRECRGTGNERNERNVWKQEFDLRTYRSVDNSLDNWTNCGHRQTRPIQEGNECNIFYLIIILIYFFKFIFIEIPCFFKFLFQFIVKLFRFDLIDIAHVPTMTQKRSKGIFWESKRTHQLLRHIKLN